MNRKHWLLAMFVFILGQGVALHLTRERVARDDRHIFKTYDPRGALVETYRKNIEQAYFQIRGSFARAPVWPGLAAFQFSLTWLRVLASTYDHASAEGDFSWLFHKLRFIAQLLPENEASFRTAHLPFFVVLGKDPAGSLYLLNEKLARPSRVPDWRVPYWAGFHALENLKEKKMAGDLFLRAAQMPGSPHYLPALGFRLVAGEDMGAPSLRKEALGRLSPELIERIKKLRPEWF